MPQKFITLPPGRNPYIMLLSTLSDVYNISFDEWWERQKVRLKRVFGYRKSGPIESPASIEEDLDQCIDSFIQSEGREPSAYELRDCFVHFLKRESDKTLLLRVDLTHEPKVIKDELKRWITSNGLKKRMNDAKSWRWMIGHQFKKATGQTPIEDLQTYLEVYDMWEEKVQNKKTGDPSGWKEIIQHFKPRAQERTADQCAKSFKQKHGKKPGVLELQEMLDEEHKRYASLERRYKRYKEKAAKIISNVEMGYFPGEY